MPARFLRSEVQNLLAFDSSLIKVHLKVLDSSDAICRLTDVLRERGYVTADYKQAVLAREEEFPTGLPTEGVRIAIPHAGAQEVLRSGIAVGILEQEVGFKNMADPDEELSVGIVFLLANNNTGEQTKILQALTNIFSDSARLKMLVTLDDSEKVAQALNSFVQQSLEEDV
jgi:galactitol PTS system EIIA component